jgi:hypothetical protein
MSSRRSRMSPGKRDRRKRNNGRVILSGRSVAVPPSLADGQVRCPACRNATTLTPNGRLRKHVDLFGNECGVRSAGRPTGIVAPPVSLPPAAPVRVPATQPASSAVDGRSRLDAGSNCRECGKWLPGERSLCGRCYALGDSR